MNRTCTRPVGQNQTEPQLNVLGCGERWLLSSSSICLRGVLFCYDSLSDSLSVSPSRCTGSVSILVRFSSVSRYAPSLSVTSLQPVCMCPSVSPSFVFHHLLLSFSHLVFHFTTVKIHASSCFIPPSFLASSLTPSHSRMKVCKHVFHMQTHCAEPREQSNHA